MKKILMLAITLGSVGQAQAFFQDLLYPTKLETTCDQAFTQAAKPHSKSNKDVYDAWTKETREQTSKFYKNFVELDFSSVESIRNYMPVTLQTGLGTIYNICSARSEKLQPLPDLSKYKDGQAPLYLYVKGKYLKSAEAKDMAAVMTLLDASGKEIARYQPTFEQEGKGWSPNCKDSPCQWEGENIYGFTPASIKGLKEKLKDTNKIRFLVSRGQGVEMFDLTSSDWGKLE